MGEVPIIPMGEDAGPGRAPADRPPRPWQSRAGLSSLRTRNWAKPLAALLDGAEHHLNTARYDGAAWLAVMLFGGIIAWFALGQPWQWLLALAVGAVLALAALAPWLRPLRAAEPRWTRTRQALAACALAFALGLALIWARSEVAGAEPLARPGVAELQGYVLEREDRAGEARLRLTLAVRDAESGAARKVRINVPDARLDPAVRAALREGAVVRLRARLMPPAAPMLPGAYDFARAAWFGGLAATGTAIGPVALMAPPPPGAGLAAIQRGLAAHVRAQIDGSPGTIAAALASGERGSIAPADEEAMRDSGLTHLLSISGLHVSALIATAYVAALRLLALWPALALRVRLPLVAAGIGALAGVGYTLLSGAEVPTVRSCAGALLVLGAMALGRDPLSLRMLALAGALVLLLWPESAVGPSFQMSFAAVLALVCVSTSGPARAFLAPREEGVGVRIGRRVVIMFVTGIVIELALMPIVLFHFHRAGVYGALANVVAIPLVTFVSMPLIALGLFADTLGLGAPFWWLAARSLDLLLWIARFTAGQPGAVRLMPQMSGLTMALFAGGGLWLALWSGRERLAGLVPVAAGALMLWATPIPDVLVSGDGRQVGITVTAADGTRRLLSLRDSRSDFARSNLLELAGVTAAPLALAEAPGARCSPDFCTLALERGGVRTVLLLARGTGLVEERALAAACARADLVVAERFLPRSCRPRWLKADRRMLERSGGLTINLAARRVQSVSEGQGAHGWWRGGDEPGPYRREGVRQGERAREGPGSEGHAESGAKDANSTRESGRVGGLDRASSASGAGGASGASDRGDERSGGGN